MPLTDLPQVLQADLDLPAHRDAVVRLLDAYAQDEMGLARPLDAAVRERLVEGLRQHPSSLIFLAEVGSHSVGLAVCFLGYSTFAARPLINIHDLIVDPKFRRQGVGERLLGAVEARGQELGCCRVTLEVRVDNAAARALYAKQGFASGPPPYEFWSKRIEST